MKKKRNKKAVPQKGDPDYLTPTQLRNRRKRRAKQQKNQQQGDESLIDAATADVTRTHGKSSLSNKTKDNETSSKNDPSMKYISNPIKAPIVQAAKQYFKPILQDCDTSDFHVHLGPLNEWRTVSKLAVRPADGSASPSIKPKVAIGLFLPRSHTLLPVPKCRAHHPSINIAVEFITKACHDVGVVPYQENRKAAAGDDADDNSSNANEGDVSDANSSIERGSGQLRYIAINVARDTGAVQITLVWNTPPPNGDGEKQGNGSKRKYDGTVVDTVLEKLVTKIISMSNGNKDANPSQIEDKEERAVATNDSTSKSTDEQQPKKRRRRGRRDGRQSSDNDTHTDMSSGNSNSGIDDRETSHTTTKTNRGNHHKLNLHSLWINYNPSWKHSNAILSFDSSCWKHVHGPPAIIEHLTFDTGQQKSNKNAGLLASAKPPSFRVPLNFPPNVFRQANLDSFTNIVGRIRERIQEIAVGGKDDGTHAIELYGGVGTIGLHVSDTVSSLVSSDENPNNAKCFYDSVHALPAKIQSRLEYRQLNAAGMVKSETALFQRSKILIVDPPRKGLDIEVVDYLCGKHETHLKLIIYVSCGFQAFQRDCNALIQSGRWKVEFAEGYLLFPGS
eukprot:CAMPEP_0181095494 /NCGR_PEP_ID=MMETSP1071-20121207/10545_1 /TAXON_ID=35127 /ORGANISM="Thalassiosira sp., Strain NH16" /LENGTH=617 /DNA_ID=CAMNT_0023177871 /DNA_START=143 /DNA_END=1992 /DNA_ORIENTATION=-